MKSEGAFTWHTHHDTDELFLLVSGRLAIKYRDKDVILEPGEMTIVPKGVEHTTEALEPCETIMIHLGGTRNTGDVENEFTAQEDYI